MAHIHTEPGQYDITVSAWIIREDADEPRVLVHMHRKNGKLMQTGGHVELDETPWQTLAHEVDEEAGYDLSELVVLQPHQDIPHVPGVAVHPVPALSHTHKISDVHFHSDYSYVFVAQSYPSRLPAEDESQDLRWLTIDELNEAAASGVALQDVADIYRFVVEKIVPAYFRVDSSIYTLEKPTGLL